LQEIQEELAFRRLAIDEEYDAQRSLHAGLGLVEAITTTLKPRPEQDKGVGLTVRLGVHTGPVVVGEMGGVLLAGDVDPLLPRHHIDLEAIKRAIPPHVMAKTAYFGGRARAEALFQFDEQDAAVAIIAPYAYGEKPEEVEVRVGSG
jgi:hypothetical protein